MARIEVSLVFSVVFSVAQSLNPKFPNNPKFPKLLGAPKTFGNFGCPCVFLDFQQKSKKHMEVFGFSAEIQKNAWKLLDFSRNPKNTWKFLDFQQKSEKKHMEIFGFSAEIQKNTWKSNISEKKQKKSKKSEISKTIDRPKNFLEILDFHVFSWIFSRNPKKHMEAFGFSAEIQKTHGNFWIFNRNPKKDMEIFGFPAEIQKNTWKSKISKSFWCAQ